MGDIYHLAIEHKFSGLDQVVTTWWFEQTSLIPLSDETFMPSFLEVFESDVLPAYNALVSANVLGSRLVVRNKTGLLAYERPIAANGTIGGDTVAPQNTCLLLKKTGMIGRPYQGRANLPPAGEGSCSGGAFNEGYLALVPDLFDAMASMSSLVPVWGARLVHYSASLDEFWPVTSLVPITRVRIQRRRRLGSGS